MPNLKIVHLPIKKPKPLAKPSTRAQFIADQIKEIPKNFTILAIWKNPKTGEYWYSAQEGMCGFTDFLGTMELVKTDMINAARRE